MLVCGVLPLLCASVEDIFHLQYCCLCVTGQIYKWLVRWRQSHCRWLLSRFNKGWIQLLLSRVFYCSFVSLCSHCQSLHFVSFWSFRVFNVSFWSLWINCVSLGPFCVFYVSLVCLWSHCLSLHSRFECLWSHCLSLHSRFESLWSYFVPFCERKLRLFVSLSGLCVFFNVSCWSLWINVVSLS